MKDSLNRRQLITDGAWATFGQVVAAGGTLLGIRVLTEFVTPNMYGSVTLLLGIAALGLGTLFTPVMQAALRFFHECSGGELPTLRNILVAILLRRCVIGIATLGAAWPIIYYFWETPWTMLVLLPLLMIVDGLRTLETVLLNAARKQRSFALIAIADAWGRPLGAVGVLETLGDSVESVLTGYLVATGSVLFFFYLWGSPEGGGKWNVGLSSNPELKKSLQQYSLPLIPTAIVGWISGLGDRYLIGGMLGVEQVGIYAAIYGLLSRPFLIASGIVELTLRPIYNQHVAVGQHDKARSIFWRWLGVLVLVSAFGFFLILLARVPIVNLLLSERYRSGIDLIPWISGGYVLLILSYVFEKVCYAYNRTAMVLLVQTLGAVFSLIVGFFGITYWGLLGAAIAAPFYFGLQLLFSIMAAWVSQTKALRQDRATRGEVEQYV